MSAHHEVLDRVRADGRPRDDGALEDAHVVRLHRARDVDLLLPRRDDAVHLVVLLGGARERPVLDLDLRQLDRLVLLLLHERLERLLVVDDLLVGLLEGRESLVDLLLVGLADDVHLILERLHARVLGAVLRREVGVVLRRGDERVSQSC